ncbi:MAG: elongation factor Ts [Spirochaetaceae bacterium]|nr:elongation factor Ts [Spirochaetaceae bacterium]
MDIKAIDVKKLREMTGAGMMDCKNALTEAGGDFKKAEKLLKEQGLAAAAKRGGRATNEGRVFTLISGKKAGILEVSCETDFVARNDTFVDLGKGMIADMVNNGVAADGPELAAKVQNAITTIKENMTVRRGKVIEADANELFTDYVHGDTGRIGVIVKIKTDKPELLSQEPVTTFAFDLALHVAAFRPQFLSADTVDEDYRTEQEEIFLAQARQLDKPENILQGIAKGKMKKHLSGICLLEQGFVKDEKRSVSQVAKDLGKQVGGDVSVSGYVYYSVGEAL